MNSSSYEIMKTIYQTAQSTDESRISVLQSSLSQLPLPNIATLDALMTHFTRLIELTSADEAYVVSLATTLAPCILRPRTETSMTMEEKYAYRLVRDLFSHKEAIFSELKRGSSLKNSGSIDTRRPRAISTDESSRKANQEAQMRAKLQAAGSRSRATSPAPSPRGHRRDRSSGGPETRFPIVASPVLTSDHRAGAPRNSLARQSLEVPDTPTLMAGHEQPAQSTQPANGTPITAATPLGNGFETPKAPKPGMSATYVPGLDDNLYAADSGSEEVPVQKRDSTSSITARAARFGGRKPIGGLNRNSLHEASKRNSLHEASKRDSVSSESQVGVTLVDKPMDD